MTKILSAWGEVMQKKVDCYKRWGAGQSGVPNSMCFKEPEGAERKWN